MTILQILGIERNHRHHEPETAERILAALADGMSERKAIGLPYDDLAEIYLAIYELKKLVAMPPSELRADRMNQMVAEFGEETVVRWLSRIRVTTKTRIEWVH